MVVVGAGPAGLSAAVELVERGVRVTLLEGGPRPGGALAGWSEDLDGAPVALERDVVGVWDRSAHAADLIERYGIPGALGPGQAGLGLRAPGRELHAGDLGSARALAQALRTDAGAQGAQRARQDLRAGQAWLRGLTPERAVAELGGRSVAEWHAAGAPATFWRVYAEPLCRAFFGLGPEAVDAAEFALCERFYGAGRGVTGTVRWLTDSADRVLWSPLVESLERQGATIRLGAPVSELVVTGGRVVGVRVGVPQAGVQLESVDQGWSVVDRADAPPIHVLREGEDVQAWAGGRPEDPGAIELFVDHGADGWHIEGEEPSDVLRADAVILAAPLPVTQALAGGLVPGIEGLQTRANDVARFWLDRPTAADRAPAVALEGTVHASACLLVHRLQDAARHWAAAQRGAVVQVAAHRDVDPGADGEALLDQLQRDVFDTLPELAGARVLKRSLTRGRDALAPAPGWLAHAPGVQDGPAGLLLAGDHVRLARHTAGLERAVLSGRVAANVVLADAGLATAPVL